MRLTSSPFIQVDEHSRVRWQVPGTTGALGIPRENDTPSNSTATMPDRVQSWEREACTGAEEEEGVSSECGQS